MSAGKVPPKLPALPVLGSARGRFRLELDTAPGDGTGDPFLPLEDSGRLARLLLGRVASADGALLRPLAVKIQTSSPAAGPPGPGQDPVTNAQIDELWRRERENLRALGSQAGPGLADAGDDAFRNLPLAYCRKTSLTFHPPCPGCLGPLGDCRDDALLREAGLPEYASSASRYLHCAACGSKPRVFYAGAPSSDERPRADVVIRRRGELYRDLGRAVRAGAGDAEAFPCLGCAHRQECYPAGTAADQAIPAESRLTPVSFHDFHMLLHEPMELAFDEACDLAGGATWADVRGRAARGGAGRERLLAPLDAALDTPFQWLFRGDTLGRFPLEVLLLKLSLFLQAAGELRTFHRLCRQPHLDLSPKNVGVSVPAAGTALPARWGFRARLAVASGPRRLFPAASAPAAARELWAPSPDADKAHLSPFVREAAPGQVENLRIGLLGGTRGLVLPGRARLDHWRPRDVVRVVPSSGALEGATLWGVLEARDDQGFAFAAELPADTRPSEFQAAVAHYPRFQPPCDLYGLGLLLLRALAANDENDAFAVEDAVQRVLKKFSVALEGKGAPSSRRAAVELGMLLDEERGVFGPAALLRRREDRARRESALPAGLWNDVLLFAFKLVTRTKGFSFAADHADVPPDRPDAPLEAVTAEAGALRARVTVELFGREQRDGEIHEACAELLGKLAGAGGA